MTSKVNKKLTFGHFFKKRAIPLLIAAAMLCVIGISALYLFMFIFFDTSNTAQTYQIRDYIHQFKQEHIEPVMDYMLCIMSDNDMTAADIGLDTGAVILDPETGELVGSPEFAVFAIVQENSEDEPVIYTCRDEDVLKYYQQYRDKNIEFDFDDIYLREDGISFRPGKVTVTELNGDFTEVISRLDERDFTPSDMTGYTHANAYLTIAMGADKENKSVNILMETVVGKPSNEADRAMLYSESFDTYQYSTFTVGDKEYAFFGVLIYSFWSGCGAEVIISSIVMLALAALAAFIWAKLAYNKYSVKYESEEYRRGMVNALAHDLKTPLMAISGYAENLQSGAHPEKAEHYTSAILDSTRSMNTIIENVLELSKLDNITAISKEQANIPSIAADVFEKYRPLAESRGISFTSSGECVVSADRKLMEQALENLFANAVKYTDDNGKIELKAETRSITLTNTYSAKIDKTPEELCRPFVRGDSSRTERSGTGMGLAIVKNICDLHGFDLEVKTDNVFKVKMTFK